MLPFAFWGTSGEPEGALEGARGPDGLLFEERWHPPCKLWKLWRSRRVVHRVIPRCADPETRRTLSTRLCTNR